MPLTLPSYTNNYNSSPPCYDDQPGPKVDKEPQIHIDKVEFNKTVNVNIPAEDPTAAIIRAVGDFLNNVVNAVINVCPLFWSSRPADVSSAFNHVEKVFNAIIPR
ncbi:MAG: hypothetical protein JSR46_06880 [Verrucomicrobia bacterium]|nr:hypothetical protein [Verrucomicrobiota bacterium]